jgi:hypothetical protein
VQADITFLHPHRHGVLKDSVSFIFTHPYSVFEAEFRTMKKVNAGRKAGRQRSRALLNEAAVGACPCEERINLLCG